MTYVIRFVALADGRPGVYAGLYLAHYDAAYIHPTLGYDGGRLEVTDDPSRALRFADAAAAAEKWKEQAPPPYDLRPDGQPNRPLTAFTVEVLKI